MGRSEYKPGALVATGPGGHPARSSQGRGRRLEGAAMAAVKRSWALEQFWKVHPWLYRLSGGRIGGRVIGLPVLLLTTTGRRSGQPRTRALTYFPQGEASVVVASYLGEPRHPDWWLNLQKNPVATVQRGRDVIRVRAREVDGAERERLWREITAAASDYAEYQTRTARRIPVVLLEPEARRP
jgi:deazaflavin-dependent oxidoreductase (nitroreductase family)